ADQAGVGGERQRHAVDAVGQGGLAGGGKADVVALDDGQAAADGEAELRVARNDVAGARRGPADAVARAGDEDAAGVADGQRVGHVGTDPVALDRVVGPRELDADVGVARDEVASAGGRPADGVVVAADPDADAVGDGGRADRVGADAVGLDAVAGGL